MRLGQKLRQGNYPFPRGKSAPQQKCTCGDCRLYRWGGPCGFAVASLSFNGSRTVRCRLCHLEETIAVFSVEFSLRLWSGIYLPLAGEGHATKSRPLQGDTGRHRLHKVATAVPPVPVPSPGGHRGRRTPFKGGSLAAEFKKACTQTYTDDVDRYSHCRAWDAGEDAQRRLRAPGLPQAEREDMLEQAEKDHAAGLLFPSVKVKVPEHPPAPRQRPRCLGCFGMTRTVWWQICGDCNDDNTDDDMEPEEHNEAEPAAAAPASSSAPGRTDGRPCGACRQVRRQHRK